MPVAPPQLPSLYPDPALPGSYRADLQPAGQLKRAVALLRAHRSVTGTPDPGGHAMIRRPATARAPGFTLIELLVALFITAMIFSIGYGGINQALNHHEELKDASGAPERGAERRAGHGAGLLGTRGRARSATLWARTGWPASPPRPAMHWRAARMPVPRAARLRRPPDDDDADDSFGARPMTAVRTWSHSRAAAGQTRPASSAPPWSGCPTGSPTARCDACTGPCSMAPRAACQCAAICSRTSKPVSFRFMNDARQWTDQWPPLGSSSLRSRPFAVRDHAGT